MGAGLESGACPQACLPDRSFLGEQRRPRRGWSTQSRPGPEGTSGAGPGLVEERGFPGRSKAGG